MTLKSRVSKVEQRMGVDDGPTYSALRINSVSPNGSPKDGLAAVWFVTGPYAGQNFHRAPDETPAQFAARIEKAER